MVDVELNEQPVKWPFTIKSSRMYDGFYSIALSEVYAFQNAEV